MGVCRNVDLRLGNNSFQVNLYIVHFHDVDVILGVLWLQMLSQITFDYNQRSITFVVDSTVRTMTNITPIPPLENLLPGNEDCNLFYLRVDPNNDSSQPTQQNIHPAVQVILDYFVDSLAPPKGLPQSRPNDHAIVIHPGAGLVKVRPYQYPHFQKVEMTKLVEKMLEDGIIQPSHSPYSSPVILLRKKDGL